MCFTSSQKLSELQAAGTAKPALDVVALAEHLGLAGSEQKNLLYIAQAALNAQVPFDWVEHTDSNGAVFFYNKSTGQSTWEHPMDKFFKMVADKGKNGLLPDTSISKQQQQQTSLSVNTGPKTSAGRREGARTCILEALARV